jgi:UDP-N-acetyl-D-mannosaminuronate dehydrogenase
MTPEASKKTYEFYSSFCDNLVEVSSPEVAEAAKLFENTFRQVNIALVNEFAQIAHALGISVHQVHQSRQPGDLCVQRQYVAAIYYPSKSTSWLREDQMQMRQSLPRGYGPP